MNGTVRFVGIVQTDDGAQVARFHTVAQATGRAGRKIRLDMQEVQRRIAWLRTLPAADRQGEDDADLVEYEKAAQALQARRRRTGVSRMRSTEG